MTLLAGFETLPTIHAGNGLSGGTTPPGREFFCYSLPVTTSGTAEKIDLNIFKSSDAETITVKQWRLNGSTLEFISESSIGAVSAGVNTDIALNTPLQVQTGDIIGLHQTANSGGGFGRLTADADSIKWKNGAATDYSADINESEVPDGLALEIAFSLRGTSSGGSGNPVLNITTPDSQSRMKQRNGSNQHTYTVAGSIADLPANAVVRYSLDGGAYQTLDANPSTTFSGSVTVTSTQDVTIDIYDGTTSYSSQTITLRAVAWILGDGQSNMASRGFNNQSLSLESGAKTPVALKGSVFSVASDPMGIDSQAAGSWQMEFLSLLANANKNITYGFANVAEGGTSVNRWIKSASDLYPRTTNAFNLTGGFEYAITLLGETDANNSMSQAEAETKYGSFIDAKKADFGVNTYLVNFPKLNYSGNDAMRAAFAELVANNGSCLNGGDLRPLDIANTGGDGIHLQTDSQLSGAANIIYSAITNGVNQPPTANAGPDQSVAAATQFTLDGTGSQDTDGTIVEWRWTQTAGDTVTLDLENPSSPRAISPSKITPQTLTFSLVTVDDEGAASSPSLVNIDVAAVVQNDVLNIIDKISFTFESDGMITAFPGRANRETFRLKPSDPTGLVLEDGWFDFEANDVRRVEISMLETTGVKIISSDTDSITRERSKLHVRMGDMPIKSSTKEFEPTVSVFVGDDERGVVMTAPGLSGAPKVKYYSTTARAV